MTKGYSLNESRSAVGGEIADPISLTHIVMQIVILGAFSVCSPPTSSDISLRNIQSSQSYHCYLVVVSQSRTSVLVRTWSWESSDQ